MAKEEGVLGVSRMVLRQIIQLSVIAKEIGKNLEKLNGKPVLRSSLLSMYCILR